MHKYRLVAKKGEGTFSEVLKAQCIKNGKYVAIKCMKNHFDSLDQVNNLREIQALRRLSPHGNIVKLLEVLYDQPTGRLALVFELMDMNIYELIRGRRHYVAEDRIKTYVYQLVKSMDHMHRNGIFHRDIKPENILIMDDCLKLADFGSCRGIYSKQPYTEYISTRWYRAPECLLTDGYYNYKMDMWGVGCVFFEMVSLFPLFPGANELDQIQKIHNVVGTPKPELLAKMKQRSQHMDFNFAPKSGSGIEKLIPHCAPECVDLITKLLAYDPDDRLSARQALRHPYFREIREAEKRRHALLHPKNALASDVSAESNAARDAAKHAEREGREGRENNVGSGIQIPRAPAPSVASTGTNASDARRRGGARDESRRATTNAPSNATSSKDLPSVGVERGARDGARATRAPPPSHAGSAASSHALSSHHRDAHARAHAYERGAYAASSVSGASVLSAGGISLGGSALGVGGSRFKGAAHGGGGGSHAAGMRGGVVGKHYGGGGGGGVGDGRMQRLGNRREENAERSAAPLAGVGVRGNAPSAKHRDGAVREKYVSPYGQRR
uniref:Protein kinase domain-containing protein n=1 Tax=Micromonas pusilla TaxID=38833 RepID=A0A7S0CSC8_MICPS|mmetsp:Transcript_10975/g.46873  ORF Transcript_10975/g.46873 Transcript_10975/m.46873 type:complete len:557 (+) Transcript_10975:133-1803(+)